MERRGRGERSGEERRGEREAEASKRGGKSMAPERKNCCRVEDKTKERMRQ